MRSIMYEICCSDPGTGNVGTCSLRMHGILTAAPVFLPVILLADGFVPSGMITGTDGWVA